MRHLSPKLEDKIFETFNACCKALQDTLREEAELDGKLAAIAVEKHRLATFIKYYSETRGFAIEPETQAVLASCIPPNPPFRQKHK